MSITGGLTVTAPAGAVCGLYPNAPKSSNFFQAIVPENAIPATCVVTAEGITTYYYDGLEAGLYHCAASMEGYCALCQMLHYTPGKAGMRLDMKLDKLAGNGYEAGYVMRCTQEFTDGQMLSSQEAWGPEYAKLFQTPQFLQEPGLSGRHQQTTNEELTVFIANLAKSNKHMHVFSLGTSPKYGFDMPLVLFTRENIAGKTLSEAAGIIRSNGKSTVQYTAQCHGTEPASCEGALAMMLQLCGDYGKRVLDDVDVYIIPRINPDGAHDVMRHSPTTNEDMNRDYLRVHNREISMVIGAYNLFLPEIALDGHEKRNSILCTGEDLCTDMELQVGAGSLNHPAEMTGLAMDMAQKALGKGRELGLRTHFYSKLASAAGGSAGSSYFGTRNSLSFLVETPGQAALGSYFMERRVLAHFIFASTIIDYAAEHAREVMDTVHASREQMVRTGAIYNEHDLIVLEHEKAETGHWSSPLIHVPTGKVVEPDHRAAYTEHTLSVHARPRATAYVLPKGLINEDEILRVVGCHGIPYDTLRPGQAVKLRQYIQEGEEIRIGEERRVCFKQGAYVFPNTVPSTVLGVIMEPDFNQISGRKMTLLSMGLVGADPDGRLPIYRYCHDLTEGKVAVEI